jgi:hypothetical protein
VLAWLGAIVCHIFPFLIPFIHSGWPQHQVLVLQDFLSSTAATTAAMTLGRDEMVRVQELDEHLLSQIGSKHRVLYSESGDNWVAGNSAQVVQTINNPGHIKFIPVPHAFCISKLYP